MFRLFCTIITLFGYYYYLLLFSNNTFSCRFLGWGLTVVFGKCKAISGKADRGCWSVNFLKYSKEQSC